MNRQTASLAIAINHISDVNQCGSQELSDAYGSLCHWFPIAVRTNGLSQALAFIYDKGQLHTADGDFSPLEQAHRFLWQHAAAGIGAEPNELLDTVRRAENIDYLRYTVDILDRWIYYKRFAASVLGVASDSDDNQQEEWPS